MAQWMDFLGGSRMKLWLDDVRPPHKYGRLGWHWAKTYDEAISALETRTVVAISLDHDLQDQHYDGTLGEERTGYHVVLWMEENGVWPDEVYIHSLNPVGRERMAAVMRKHSIPHTIQVALL